MGPVLYHMTESVGSRAALTVARMLNVDLDVQEVDLFDREQLPAEFVKANPQCTVPTLDDDGFVVVDGHAIATYLADKYGGNEKLYPKEVAKRSLVDQRLYFDAVVLFTSLRDYLKVYKTTFSVFFTKAATISEEHKIKGYEALNWLNEYLIPTEWVAGNHLTIADVFCVSSVTTFQDTGFDLTRYPHIESWITKCQESFPDYDASNRKIEDTSEDNANVATE